VGASVANPTALESQIRSAWAAFKTKDKNAFAAMLAEGLSEVEEDGSGFGDKTAILTMIDQFELAAYKLKDFKVMPIAEGAALVTYNAEYEGKGRWTTDARENRLRRDLGESRSRMEAFVCSGDQREIAVLSLVQAGVSQPCVSPRCTLPLGEGENSAWASCYFERVVGNPYLGISFRFSRHPPSVHTLSVRLSLLLRVPPGRRRRP
jgi:hypothetical protein